MRPGISVSAMAISQNIGTAVTALLPALFAAVAPPGATNVPSVVGAITFAITVVAALAAISARETYRIHMNDLGQAGAVPVDKADYDRMRDQAIDQVRTTVGQLRQALQSNRTIGTAVGILMTRYDLEPKRAFQVLVRTSQQNNRKMNDIAEELLRTGELPGVATTPVAGF